MKKSIQKIILLLLIAAAGSLQAFTQITPKQLVEYIAVQRDISQAEVYDLYSRLNYQTVWIQNEHPGNLAVFLNTLKQAADYGLQEKDYRFSFLESFRNKNLRLRTLEDSLEAEVKFSDAAIHFYRDVAYGNTKPPLGYNGLKYTPACLNITALLAGAVSKNALPALIAEVSGVLPEIGIIEKKIRWFNSVMKDSNYKEVIILSNKISSANKPLITKLYQLGVINTLQLNVPDSSLKKKVKEAQTQFSLLADGTLRSTALQELNIPLQARLQQLNISLNYYRWLNCLVQNQQVIVVNIPAAYLKVYRNSEVILEMRMIVGKRSTPTPTLMSTVQDVILYPYWHVPYKIATRELLPAIKRNPGYINAGNYQVLNRSGNIADPRSINWNALSVTNFPYIIRQSTGCDNALGLLKLNFYNPFGVYLHDTNNKYFFGFNRRYFSHGCMRMQKPIELGHLILKNNAIAIDTLEQKGCLRNQSPITVPAVVRMPVMVWYNPAGIDSTGRVLFYEDVYKKFVGLK